MIEGRSHIDESVLTVELIPVEKSIGSSVIGATLNGCLSPKLLVYVSTPLNRPGFRGGCLV